MKTCAFTGHRPQHLPFGMNENDERCVKLKEELKEQIEDTRDDLNPRLRLAGCLITCFIRADAEKQGEAWLRSRPEYPVFDTRIRYSDKVTESTFSEIPIVEYSRRSGTAMDYIAFVREYLRRGKK